MALRFFTIPVRSPTEAERELNAVLAGQRVLTVERRFVDVGPDSFWSVCVDYLPGAKPEGGGGLRENGCDRCVM